MRFFTFLCLLLSGLFAAQQNSEFKKVKDFYDNHRFMLAKEFRKKFDNEQSAFERSVIKNDFETFMRKMDSIQNSALIGALISVKNAEDLKKIQQKISAETVLHPKSNSQIEVKADYPGGMNEMRTQVGRLFYFDGVVTSVKTLKADVVFVVEKDGSISSVHAEGDNFSFNRQAEIAMYLLPHKFSPAMINGMAVRYRFRLPLTMNFE